MESGANATSNGWLATLRRWIGPLAIHLLGWTMLGGMAFGFVGLLLLGVTSCLAGYVAREWRWLRFAAAIPGLALALALGILAGIAILRDPAGPANGYLITLVLLAVFAAAWSAGLAALGVWLGKWAASGFGGWFDRRA
ncbi:MAG: hypothetical protein ACR2J8_01710 [Thermomicrobiales bacterium]